MSNETPVIDFPAFPGRISDGMTLRDYAAIHFFAARLANPIGRGDITDHDMAVVAYQRADALLRAREATR